MVEISWRTIGRILLAAAVVWLVIALRQIITVFVVAIVLATALDPAVVWLSTRTRLSRALAVAGVAVVLVGVVGAFLYFGWASLASQSQLTMNRFGAFWDDLVTRYPYVKKLFSGGGAGTGIEAGAWMMTAAARAGFEIVFGFILTIYFLIDGARTYRWLRSFVPHRHRRRVDTTAREARRTVAGYIAGNMATATFATIFVFTTMSLLHVPAALVLALLAGLCDFVPVLGFLCSALPAILLALTVSPATALGVVGLYLLYHVIENYFIAPRIYGNRLQLSGTAVVAAFAIGAELAGVVGAILALPIAAVYPCVEQIWLADRLGDAVVEHKRIMRKT